VLDPEEGILYPALRRLEEKGLVRGRWGKTETGRKARFYTLTKKGQKTLASEMARWEEHAGAVFAVLAEGEE
jgi:DNA-binding PadR family transcriptional regulator